MRKESGSDPVGSYGHTTQQTQQDPALLGDLRQLIDGARTRAAQAVNAEITLLYWQVGKRIRTDILKHERAGYGLEIVSALSRQLTAAYGKGWGSRQLHHCLRFAETIPQLEIVNALRTQLTWTHLRQVIGIDDSLKRDFYLEMCRLEKWSTRQLQERIDSMLYERTALSKQPEETIRHDLALLREMEEFLLEMGAGFTFVARQKRMQIDSDDFYLDLLFYNRKIRRLVAIDLKLGSFRHEHKSQMELYLRWLAKHEQEPSEEPPLGIILCAGKKQEQIELLELDKSGIHVAEYLTVLPPRKLLAERLHRSIEAARARLSKAQEDAL